MKLINWFSQGKTKRLKIELWGAVKKATSLW